ncbi:MAG: calcium-binding protein [Sulfuricaulis sp.]|nr:calcium-binding protein [Sulfuricaulis sp.]
MATITNYFEQAQLSLAAYALNLLPGMSGQQNTAYVSALTAPTVGMSDAQARNFADTYTVVDQYTDPLTGFSGTVFTKNGVNYFALRGTEGLFSFAGVNDWLTNVTDVGTNGIAVTQGLAMFNWLQRLYGAPNSAVVQYVYNPILGTIETFTGALPASGYLSGSLSPVSVTGHSLGGQLAMMLSRLAPGVINSVYAYNAPGFDVFNSGLTSGGFFNLLRNAPIGPITGAIGTGWNNGIMTRSDVEGDVVHGIGYSPSQSSPAFEQIIFSENANQGVVTAHDIKAITDSLAIYNLFATLDPALNNNPVTGVSKITDILKASSSNVLNRDTYDISLENALDALRTLFQENYQNSTSRFNATATQRDGRDDFYTKLFSLQEFLKGSALNIGSTTSPSYNLTVDSLTKKSTADFISAAQTGLATRYALYKLNPFTVNGTGLYETINTDRSLDLYNSSTRTGALTDEYLKDRAAFLYNKIVVGNQNNDVSGKAWVPYTGAPQHFQDGNGTLAYHFYLGADSSVVSQPLQNISNIIFDDWTSNTLTGGTQGDKLYGLAGNDTLTGGKGNDYLEGGKGNDNYIFTSGDGLDLLLDTDHQGTIKYDNTPLTGGPRALQNNNVYQSPDRQFTYTLIGSGTNSTLFINTPGGAIQIKDFQSGDLGITLPDAPPPTFTSTFPGTVNNDADLTDTGAPLSLSGGGVLDKNWTGYAPLGQKLTNPGGVGGMYFISRAGQPYPADTIFEVLYGKEGDDFLLGNPGAQNFTLDAGSGNDWIISDYNDEYSAYQSTTPYTPGQGTTVYAGAGHDAVQGGFRNDWIDANTGHDQVIGLEGCDYINGGSGNDWLAGNRDDDILIGGPATSTTEPDHDTLLGGNGSDYLNGGAGDDTLYGDASGGFARRVVDVGNGTLYLLGWNGETRTHLIPNFVGSSSTLALLADAPLYEDGGYPAPGYTPSPRNEDYLDGGAGVDKLFGGVGNDILDGGADNDKLYGEADDDQLLGGDGNDKLWGDLDNAVFNQDQQITSTYGTLSLFNREYANETLAEGNDILEGGNGDDELRGGGGNDTLRGGPDTDILVGGAGADTLDGGTGNDTIYRDAFDTLVFRPGDGQDQVTYGGGVLQLDGLTIDQFQISNVAGSDGWQYLALTNGTDSVSLQGGFLAASQTFSFSADTLTQQQLMTYAPSMGISGTSGADTIYGSNQIDTIIGYQGDDTLYGQGGDDIILGWQGSDVLVGGEGCDTLEGGPGDDIYDGGPGDDFLNDGSGGGSDIYVFGRGYGQDFISDFEGANDTLRFAQGLAVSDIVITRDNSNLYFSISGAGDKVTVDRYYGTYDRLDRVEFNGGPVWLPSDIESRIYIPAATEGSDSLYGSSRDDTLLGLGGNDTLNGYAGNDTLNGGAGDDLLVGGDGSDVYVFGRGYGQDMIADNSFSASDVDTLRFLPGVTIADLTVTRTGDYLYVDINGTGDRLSIGWWNGYGDETPALERIELADGTLLPDITTLINVPPGTPGIDSLLAGNGNDLLNGLAGDDYLEGQRGNDILIGGPGKDNAGGGKGSDLYLFNSGDGVLPDPTTNLQEYIHDAPDPDPTDVDTLSFGTGIRAEDIYAYIADWNGSSELVLKTQPTGETIHVEWQGSYIFQGALIVEDYRIEHVQFLNPDEARIFDLAGIVTARGDALRAAYDPNASSPAGIPLFTSQAMSAFDITATSTIAPYAFNYAFHGDVFDPAIVGAGIDDAGLYGTSVGDKLYGLAGNDQLLGLEGDDQINGGLGNDTLDGGTGADTLTGGPGNDTYLVDDTGDTITENLNEGTDTVQSAVTYTLGANGREPYVNRCHGHHRHRQCAQ